MRDTDVDKISKYFDKIVMGKNSANDDGSKLAHSNKKMSGVHWTAQDSKARSNELVSMNEAHTLHFNIESIGDKLDFGNMLLRVALIGMMSLRHIILSCGSIDGLAAKTVLDNVLCSMASLKSLHLRINYFGASSSEPLNTALLAMDDLSILNINCLDVGPHFVNKLVLTLVKLTSLHTLEISCNYIEATGVKALCNILGEMTHLTTLDLSDNTFLSTGTLFLAPQLNKLSTLDILDLSKNNLGDDGCITLFNNITGMEALEELYLSDNSILDLGSAAIGTNIPKLLYLSTLDLSGNRINMKCLGRGCQECQFLISLDISDNFIEDDGLQDFCKYLPNFELLQSLSLNSNHIRSDGVKYLRTALRKKRDPIGYVFYYYCYKINIYLFITNIILLL